MKNRYGIEYWFEEVEPKTYRFQMDENVGGMRMGGREGQTEVDMNDLGMVDYSGGPFVAIGSEILLDEVNKPLIVKRIMGREEGIFVEVI